MFEKTQSAVLEEKMDESLSKLGDQNIEMVDITKEATKENELVTKVNFK